MCSSDLEVLALVFPHSAQLIDLHLVKADYAHTLYIFLLGRVLFGLKFGLKPRAPVGIRHLLQQLDNHIDFQVVARGRTVPEEALVNRLPAGKPGGIDPVRVALRVDEGQAVYTRDCQAVSLVRRLLFGSAAVSQPVVVETIDDA